MIHLSTAAVSEIERVMSKQQQKPLFRLAVKPGGCSGLFYDMAFESVVNDNDIVLNSHGIQVVIDTQSFQRIEGLHLDYSEDLMGGAFRFHNPQASTTCGCGNSFSIN
ncbi:iron-sulfur cluster assembly accessory protein [Aetokthonos hydrillicola Thurmond2011]|jgi:iron-sulfur cluster assembly accessory protein|uniref:Iron-sulfur cluster assembly accessory protein n=1 Tax=Aetokthonos hydrillicola Thurmond2011 TaxID=2712845 RepID=A0AAP5M9A0_9CYAN|nr:iron-sulfur cluster assembly accessory protein [Aetokthonos hydrillicola]MBO3460600.1 iron-sulfur cluster assembly accessory protein [Aetokthonos hydrillicola CCALA 1050]MBW4587821.1 iron-sulfur cluster assembly accessory protein [Aetokthonos hydrillicola CCALA 1050]MDR9894468.1 iron-sulfur cluster assembly accessory protein [Aetokthonos hydrillicola Thurmond2011]